MAPSHSLAGPRHQRGLVLPALAHTVSTEGAPVSHPITRSRDDSLLHPPTLRDSSGPEPTPLEHPRVLGANQPAPPPCQALREIEPPGRIDSGVNDRPVRGERVRSSEDHNPTAPVQRSERPPLLPTAEDRSEPLALVTSSRRPNAPPPMTTNVTARTPKPTSGSPGSAEPTNAPRASMWLFERPPLLVRMINPLAGAMSPSASKFHGPRLSLVAGKR